MAEGEHGSWENRREGPDISDVTLVSGHEDRREVEKSSSGEKEDPGGRLLKSVENRARQGDKGVCLDTLVQWGLVGSSTVVHWSSTRMVSYLDKYGG